MSLNFSKLQCPEISQNFNFLKFLKTSISLNCSKFDSPNKISQNSNSSSFSNIQLPKLSQNKNTFGFLNSEFEYSRIFSNSMRSFRRFIKKKKLKSFRVGSNIFNFSSSSITFPACWTLFIKEVSSRSSG